MKRLLPCLVLVTALALACSRNEGRPATVTPPPTDPGGAAAVTTPSATVRTGPTLAPVPGAFATAGGRTIRGGEGSRCWGNSCVDMVGPITNVEVLVARPGERIALDFEGGPPSRVSLEWWAVSTQPGSPGTPGLVWAAGLTPLSGSPSGNEAPTTAGSYVLTALAAWEGRGDISFGFYIQVR